MTELGAVMPVYLLIDQSASMASVMHELNASITSLLDALAYEPMAASRVRLSIIGFSDEVTALARLVDARDIYSVPALATHGSTSYRALFRFLSAQVPIDIEDLKSEGYAVHRPLMFFLTDGAPNEEDWREELSRLRSPRNVWRPTIVAYGIGDAPSDVILEVASERHLAYRESSGVNASQLLRGFFQSLVASTVYTTNRSLTGDRSLVIEAPEGFRSIGDDDQ